MVRRRNIRRLTMPMTAVMRHLLLRWVISSSNAIVAARLVTEEMSAPTRNKVVPAEAVVVMERDQAISTRETATIAVSSAM